MEVQVGCMGMGPAPAPDSCVFVIFGATGDLARTTLVPALFGLHRKELLPKRFAIIGFSRKPWSDDQYRTEMHGYVSHDEGWAEFARRLFYVPGDFTDPDSDSLTSLRERIAGLRREYDLADHVLFHLSTPPEFYGEIAHKLDAAHLLRSDNGWRRLIIEKPFGDDEASARALDRQLLEVIDERSIYRIDHFLGKETVQNMLVFRFANPAFEPIWNHQYIDHVEITAAESEGIGTRAGYYDESGVIRDMVQNHLLQLLCITAMEPPVAYNADSLRDETVKVLQSIRKPDPQQDWVLGQYGAGSEVVSYRQEKGVAADSRTPTYAAVRLHIDNWRWSGVPFYLRSGKRLANKVTTICIHFKPTPHLMFALDAHHDRPQSNVLTFRVQPEEGILYRFIAKQPGPRVCLQPVTMTFRYDTTFGIKEPPSAYQWLLEDALLGDQTLFARSDWIYKAWSLVDAAVNFSEQGTQEPIFYPPGSWGPPQAERLLGRHVWQCVES